MAPRPNDWIHMQQFLEDFQENFQDNMRQMMAEAIQAGVQARVQAAFAAHHANAQQQHAAPLQHQHRNNNPIFDEQDDDIDDENPFGDNNRQLHRHERHNRNEDTRWTSGLKIDIPEYHGGSQLVDLLDKIVTVDEFIEFKDFPEHKKVPLITTRFRGHAASW